MQIILDWGLVLLIDQKNKQTLFYVDYVFSTFKNAQTSSLVGVIDNTITFIHKACIYL